MDVATLVSVRSLQQNYRTCWKVAFSSFDNAIDHLLALIYMDLQQLAILEMSCQLPVFWLGKLCFTTITKGVRTFSDSLCRTMRQWSMNLMVHMVFSGMVMLNPRLTERQQYQLMSVITRALEQLYVQHSLDERLMKGIVALACPDRGSCLLVTYLIEVLRGLASSNNTSMSNQSQGDLEAGCADDIQEDAMTARMLLQEFRIDRMYIAAMPPLVRKAVLAALTREMHSSVHDSHGLQLVKGQIGTPSCCITLEPLLQLDGKIAFDVVAVIQGNSRTGEDHAFLYRGTALYNWLGKPQVPISPETRSVVRPMDVYRLS